jgi:hypothetical protein
MLKNIIEQFEETEFLKADGFDEAVMGFDLNSDRLIYSISKMLEILMNDGMEKMDAIEYLEFNTFATYVGEKTPIYMWDLK